MSAQLLPNLVLFGRLLRAVGMDVNPGRMIDLVDSLEFIEIGHREDFFHAARCLLVHDREDLPLFDLAFELFWRKPVSAWPEGTAANVVVRGRTRRPRMVLPTLGEESRRANRPAGPSDGEAEQTLIEANRTYSSREVLRHKDFAELTAAELAAVKKLIRDLDIRLGERRTRRLRPGERRAYFDLRRSIRQSLQTEGEFLQIARREPKTRPRPIVVIADISGSMERYTRLLLHFVFGLARHRRQSVEAFVFSTRLTRITHQLRAKDIDTAISEVARSVHDWSGGTRIGEALKTFNYTWGRRVLSFGAVVLVISDGWDRGDIALLDREMDRLHRSCHRLVWLNPLLGAADYEPLTLGIKAALPHVDHFLPVHNLASLEDLGARLAGLKL